MTILEKNMILQILYFNHISIYKKILKKLVYQIYQEVLLLQLN